MSVASASRDGTRKRDRVKPATHRLTQIGEAEARDAVDCPRNVQRPIVDAERERSADVAFRRVEHGLLERLAFRLEEPRSWSIGILERRRLLQSPVIHRTAQLDDRASRLEQAQEGLQRQQYRRCVTTSQKLLPLDALLIQVVAADVSRPSMRSANARQTVRSSNHHPAEAPEVAQHALEDGRAGRVDELHLVEREDMALLRNDLARDISKHELASAPSAQVKELDGLELRIIERKAAGEDRGPALGQRPRPSLLAP